MKLTGKTMMRTNEQTSSEHTTTSNTTHKYLYLRLKQHYDTFIRMCYRTKPEH